MPKKRVICPACGELAKPATGQQVYPHRQDLYHKRFFVCSKGHDEYRVGCHGGSWKPLGEMANQQTRWARMKAHKAFDPIWKTGPMSRTEAYEWLRKRMNMTASECHIGQMSVEQCERVCEEIRNHA